MNKIFLRRKSNSSASGGSGPREADALASSFEARAAVELEGVEKELLISDQKSGAPLARWPFACISFERVISAQTPPEQNVELICPPDDRVVEMSWREFQASRWVTKLPGFESRHRTQLGYAWGGATCVAVVALIYAIPAVVSLLPFSFEKKVFSNIQVVSESRICALDDAPEAKKSLNKLVKRIFPLTAFDRQFQIEFLVARETEINAFAVPGGRIYINEGLLKAARSGDELAGVLAHEITHILQRHVLKSAADQILLLLIAPKLARLSSLAHLKFNRDQEAEADQFAVERLKTVKVSPEGFRNFFQRLETEDHLPEIFSDHPAMKERVEKIKIEPQQPATPALSLAEFELLQKICGRSRE